MSVAAIVVTYIPKEELLARVLQSVTQQVDQIYVVDNTPSMAFSDSLLAWFNDTWLGSMSPHIQYLALGKNEGIAIAQNTGIEHALAAGYQELVFFDQDSAPPSNLVSGLLDARQTIEVNGVRVGAIGPMIFDAKSQLFTPLIRAGFIWVGGVKYVPQYAQPEEVEVIISSGSLIAASVLNQVGPMLGPLFIDWVDVEWCLRAQTYGLVNYVAPSVVMEHSIGDDYLQVGVKTIYTHSNLRNFYSVRNASYLSLYGNFKFAWHCTVFLKLPLYVIFYSYTASGSRWRACKALLRAVFHGFTRQLGPAPADLF